MDRLQARARALVTGGFALTVIGGIAYLGLLIHLGYFQSGQSLAYEGEVILPILSDLSALLGWWWLTRLVVADRDQMTLVRRAYYALGLQYLLAAGVTMCEVSLEASATTTYQLLMTSLIIEAVGSLGVFIGFTVIAGVYTPRRELPRELPREHRATAFGGDDDDE